MSCLCCFLKSSKSRKHHTLSHHFSFVQHIVAIRKEILRVLEEFILKERKMEGTLKKFIARLNAGNELDKYIKLETHKEKILLTLKFMLKYDFIPNKTGMPKNKKKSEEFRIKGNTLYTKANDNKKLIETLKLYTKSIAFAPYPSMELALAYADRSAVLLELSLYSECLEDIERALALNYPDNLKAMIYGRKAECLIFLKRHFEARDTLYEQKHWIKEMSDLNHLKKLQLQMLKLLQRMYAQTKQSVTDNSTEVKESENELSNISSFNAEVPYASDAVAIKYNKDYGRHLIATRDIQPGEVIAVEKPYTLLLNQNQIRTHCSNCLKICWANIPCEHCTYAMYCSKKCRDDEWKKCHDVECNVFPALIENDCVDHNLHSLRLAVLALKEAENDMEKLKDMVKRFDKCDDPRTSNFFEDGKLHSDKYAGMYNLSIPTYTESKNIKTIVAALSFISCIIIYFLATRTEIFGTKLSDLSALMEDNNVIFFGDLISRHQWIISMNSNTFYEAHGNKYYDCGTALTSFYSLINHSCNPNVLVQARPDLLVMLVIYPIQKDEQLFVSYGPMFCDDSKEKRQKKLKKHYFFDCNCVACQKEWPTIRVAFDSELQSYMILMENAEDKAKIEKALQNLPTYYNLIKKGNVDDKPYLIQELLKMVQVLYNYAPLPCKETTSVIQLLRCAYMITGNRFKLPQKEEN